MDTRSRYTFLALILAQAAHSVEEYIYGLYQVFAPARLVSGLLSDDPARGFIVANAALVSFGLWCYVARVRAGHRSAVGWAWLWVVVECANGVGHTVLALMQGGYFPGLVTAPALLALSAYLATQLWRAGHQRKVTV